MDGLRFGLTLMADDKTDGGLRSATRRFASFAKTVSKPISVSLRLGRGGLALARDINLGLRPLVSALDDVIDRGARLETTRRSFESLTGKTAKDARVAARELVRMSNGTLTLARSMEYANRALAAGLRIGDLGTIFEFASKKAVTTGVDAAGAIDKLITGLSRGSPAFLDDFGILADGLDEVRRRVDAVQGAGTYDAMLPSVQKMNLVRLAMMDINGQLGKLGVTGREPVFILAGLKSELANARDELTSVIAGSEAMRSVLKDARDITFGLTEHFKAGGSFLDVLTGKGGKGGLLGIGSGLVVDLGENLGRAIGGGLLKVVGGAIDMFPDFMKTAFDAGTKFATAAWGYLEPKIASLLGGGGSALTTAFQRTAVIASEAGRTLIDLLGNSTLSKAANSAQGSMLTALFGGTGGNPAPATAATNAQTPGTLSTYGGMAEVFGKAFLAGLFDSVMPAPLVPSATLNPTQNMVLPKSIRDELASIKSDVDKLVDGLPLGLRLSAMGDSLLGGIGFGRTGAAVDAFKAQFSKPAGREMDAAGALRTAGLLPQMTLQKRQSIKREIAVAEDQLANVRAGGGFARQTALKRSGETIAQMRRDGYRVGDSQIRAIRAQALREEIEQRSQPFIKKIADLQKRLDADKGAGVARSIARGAGAGADSDIVEKLNKLIEAVELNTAGNADMKSALISAGRRAANAKAA